MFQAGVKGVWTDNDHDSGMAAKLRSSMGNRVSDNHCNCNYVQN